MVESRKWHGGPETPKKSSSSSSGDDDVSRTHRGDLAGTPVPRVPLPQPKFAGRALLLGNKVPMGFDVLPQRAGICVALQAACHLAVVRLVHIVGASVLEAVAGVGVTFAASLIWANVGFLPWRKKRGKENKGRGMGIKGRKTEGGEKISTLIDHWRKTENQSNLILNMLYQT